MDSSDCSSCPKHLLFCIIVIGTVIALSGLVLTMHGIPNSCGLCNNLPDGPEKDRIKLYQIIGPSLFCLGVLVALLGIYLKCKRKPKHLRLKYRVASIEGTAITGIESVDGELDTESDIDKSLFHINDPVSYPQQTTYLTHQSPERKSSPSPVTTFPPPGQNYLQPWQPTMTSETEIKEEKETKQPEQTKKDTAGNEDSKTPLWLPPIMEEEHQHSNEKESEEKEKE